MDNFKALKSKFCCEICNYKCNKNSDYEKHLVTKKHTIRINPNIINQNVAIAKVFSCLCGKIYKHRSTLCNHKNKCQFIFDKSKNTNESTNESTNETSCKKDEIIQLLIKENTEFKNLLLEQNKLLIDIIKKNNQKEDNMNS